MAIEIERQGDVAVIRGALTADFAALRERLEELAAGYGTRCAVFALQPGESAFEAEEWLWLERWPVPAVAALEGTVAGPALDLALACDIRVAANDAVLRFSRIGARRMMTVLGARGQVALLERGARLDATSAFDAGLVTKVTVPGDALAGALEMARTVALRGPIATRLAKEAILRGLPQPLEQALRFETDLTLLLQTTKDRAEGVRAFLDKRPPTFTGR